MSRWPFRQVPGPGDVRGDEEAEIREELELYLELRTEELVREGLSPEEARRVACERFGDRKDIEARVRREVRRRRGRGNGRKMMGSLRQDLAYALRSFRRNPGFTLVAVLTLGLALGGNTAIFSVVDVALLQALPFPHHERLVFVNGYHLTDGQPAFRMASIPEFRDWRERSRTVSPMAGVDGVSFTLTADGDAERLTGEIVSEGYFEILGADALLGRTFNSAEFTTPDGYPVVVLSHGLWERRFAGDREVVGRTIRLNDRPVTVVGVMPEDFRGVGLGVDVWAPLGMISLVANVGILDSRGTRFLPVVGRLAPDATVEEAQAELDAIARELQQEHPDAHEDRYAQVQTFRDGYLGTTGQLLWVLLAAGGLLLLVAAANVANLLLVRAHARTRELVVRRAMGAEGSRVAAQLLTESVVLAALGGVAGFVLAGWGIQSLLPLLPPGVLPAYADPALSGRVFGFSLLILGLVGLAAGMAPAVATARKDLAASLRGGGRGFAGGSGGVSAQQAFVVVQVGLAILLMVGAGLMTRSFRAQLAVDPGLEMEGIHVFRVQPPRERYPDAGSLRNFAAELVRRVEAVPGISSVAASSDFPFRGRSSGSYIVRADDPERLIRYHRHSVTPGYFENLGIELQAGRTFSAQDDEGARGVAIVTRAMVERVFPEDPEPVGRTIYIGPPDDPDNAAEIVGIVEDVRYRNLTQSMMAEANSPDVFFTFRQLPRRTMEISFRADRPAGELAPAVRRAVQGLDPSLAVYLFQSLEAAYRAQTATPRFAAFLMGVFSLLALVLACVGIYGVLAFTVGQRAGEIAVRRALGARVGTVAGSVIADGLRLAGVGLVLGGAGAALGSRALRSFLFNVEPTDPLTLGTVLGSMALVAVLAAAVPAWRATRKDPVEALTAE